MKALFALKYLPLWGLVLALVFFVLSFVTPGSGWGVAAGVTAAISSLWIGVTWVATGVPFSEYSSKEGRLRNGND